MCLCICLLEISECASNPCQHNGQCSEPNPDKYQCDCSGTGFTGQNCETGKSSMCLMFTVTLMSKRFLIRSLWL